MCFKHFRSKRIDDTRNEYITESDLDKFLSEYRDYSDDVFAEKVQEIFFTILNQNF